MSRFRGLAQVTSAGLLLFGLGLRVSVQDQIDGFAIFFYAMPWPVLAVLGFVAAGLWLPKRKAAAAFLGIGLMSAVVWVAQSYERNPQPTERQDLRVVSWNAEHSKRMLPEIIEHSRGFDADILGITETESTAPGDAERWRAAFPDHTVRTLPNFMLLITRGEILGTLSGSLAGRGNFNLVQLKIQERRIHVLFVDLDANPLHSRRLAFDALRSMLAKLPDEAVVMFGDFNTPRESAYFRPLRQNLQNAFEVAGQGFAETWPLPVPVLSLDHIFVSKGLRVLRCEHGASLSDHRAVIADLGWE